MKINFFFTLLLALTFSQNSYSQDNEYYASKYFKEFSSDSSPEGSKNILSCRDASFEYGVRITCNVVYNRYPDKYHKSDLVIYDFSIVGVKIHSEDSYLYLSCKSSDNCINESILGESFLGLRKELGNSKIKKVRFRFSPLIIKDVEKVVKSCVYVL